MNEFKSIFGFRKTEEMNKVAVWLKENLKEPHKMEIGHRTITIISQTKDESFKVGQWIRYQNPLGEPRNYTVIGRDEQGRIIFRSACKKCRNPDVQEPHYLHVPKRDL